MSLDHALLVSLLEKPSAGYALARRFDRSIGHFWPASHQQIYKVLARMEAAGWIDCQVERGESAPDRKVFSVTELGRQTLVDWIATPSEMETLRSALMVKLRASAFDDPRRLLPSLRLRREQHAAMLAAYRAIEARDFSGTLTTQRALQYHVLKLGLAQEQVMLDWLRDAEQLIDHIPRHDKTETA